MRTYKVRLQIDVYNPLMNDMDLERVIKRTLDADSDLEVRSMTIIED